MSIRIRIGRWRERGGGVAEVHGRDDQRIWYPWTGRRSTGNPGDWKDDGSWTGFGIGLAYDLVEYLGPLDSEVDDKHKHNAAKRLRAAAEEMQALLASETDGTAVKELVRSVVSEAEAIYLLTRPEE